MCVFNKECLYPKECGAVVCIDCMVEEINQYRKKIQDMEKVEADSIMITKDELVHAQANALAKLAMINPMTLLLEDEMTRFAALTVNNLFKEEK